jgi:hypothetical protein
VIRTAQEDLRPVETSQSTSVKTGLTTTTLRDSKPWDFPVKLLISFLEGLGRSSEELFYVYLPLSDEPRVRETSNHVVQSSS